MLPEDAYRDVPACWWGRDRFIAHALALYDMHHKLLYRNQVAESVGRDTFLAYLRAEAGGADFGTGRNARVSIAHLMRATGKSESTMHRCRRLLYKLGCRTVVYHGRQLTKLEALDRWHKHHPKIKGYTAVAALHETTVLPVDNALVQSLLDQGIGTPPAQSAGSASLSRCDGGSSVQNTMERRAPRGPDKKGRAKRAPAYDPRAVRLAARVRRDERFPLWVRQIRPGRLTAVLTRKATAATEWDVDDVFGALEEWWISGKVLLEQPRNPAGYLWTVLDAIPDDVPPARLDRARTVAAEEVERAHRARQREENRAAAMAAAGPDSPGRRAARRAAQACGEKTAGRAADRARETEWARRDLAQQTRTKPLSGNPDRG
ncbi:hypothetical protein NMK54_34405 [Nocardia otitidiscaviarum]|uniref:hypothetical protein n=1 Tax=Nocardia otitidiscaviarum TaxID=1823 RepID=UPI0020CED1C6|nr:hypothetical protein [Nocardia otitidiscaviarum]MCP9625240.1 hypothetical protein [Nocardia otitidiscaviarum]